MNADALGVSLEDARLIDTVKYFGIATAEAPTIEYHEVEFYEDNRLIATRDIRKFEDVYNIKVKRIYALARGLCEEDQKKKSRGDEKWASYPSLPPGV